MIKFCVLESIENETLLFQNGTEKVRIPGTPEEISFFAAQLNGEDPVMVEVDIDKKRLIPFHEQDEYKGELENPALIGSLNYKEEE